MANSIQVGIDFERNEVFIASNTGGLSHTIFLSPEIARNIAKQLSSSADILEPPKPQGPIFRG